MTASEKKIILCRLESFRIAAENTKAGKPALFGGVYSKADENEMHHCYQVMHDLCEDLHLI